MNKYFISSISQYLFNFDLTVYTIHSKLEMRISTENSVSVLSLQNYFVLTGERI